MVNKLNTYFPVTILLGQILKGYNYAKIGMGRVSLSFGASIKQ